MNGEGSVAESPCVAVEPREAEKARRILKSMGYLAHGLKASTSGGRVLFPVTDLDASLSILVDAGIKAEPCVSVFKRVPRGPPSPRDLDLPGYWLVGDIIVFNPREGVDIDKLASYAEELIGRGVARSAWLKVGTHGPYRLPKLVHVAGEKRTETMAKEYGLRFRVDVAKAYYNPRLSFEHRRIAEQVSHRENVLDMFTGVGGFAVHIAHLREARIVAVDINPYAAYLAARNTEINKLRGQVCVMRADAKLLPRILEPIFDRVIMNHPTASLNFIEEACVLTKPRSTARLHVYIVSASPSEAAKAVQDSIRIRSRCTVKKLQVRRVIDHSPKRFIYAVDVEVERRNSDD